MRLSTLIERLPVALAITAASGFLLSLSLPPVDVGPVALVAVAPFLWVLRNARPGRGFLLGLVFGIAYFGAVLYWILLFGELAWTALVALSAAFVGLFGMVAPAVFRRRRPVLSAVGLAALWTVIEWVRGMWPLGGFTWGGLGTTQADNPFLLPLASVAGVWGISFAIVMVNALLVSAAERGRGRPGRVASLIGVAAAVALGPGLIGIPKAQGQPVDVAAVQVDVRRAQGLPSAEEDRAVARLNVALHARLATDPPDLAMWGESALDPGAGRGETAVQVSEAIRRVGAPTLAGSIREGGDGRLFNQGVLFEPGGSIVQRYSKVHLVPFGEYVPWRGAVGWISALDQIPYDISRGREIHTLRLAGLPEFGVAICYENSFPGIDRALVRQGAGFLVVLTNNASYEETAASRQHLLMSRLRAVENGRWVVHAAVSGISAFIDPEGRVVREAGLFEPAVLRETLRASKTLTLYTRLGDWVPWLSTAVVLAVIATPRKRRPVQRPEALPQTARTLVILPTYQERATIEEVIEGLLALPEHVDMLVIDDRSPDGTAAAVRELARGQGDRVKLVERGAKAGLASAYLLGFDRALAEGYDLIVEMDSDLSHQPQELHGLLTAVHRHDMVLGSRYVPGGSVTNWSRARLTMSRVGNAYARIALGFDVRDATSGFRVYRRELLRQLVSRPIRSDGYGFQVELALRAWNMGASVGEVPITFREREHGHSKISRRIVVEALWLVTVWGLRARLRGRGNPRLPG